MSPEPLASRSTVSGPLRTSLDDSVTTLGGTAGHTSYILGFAGQRIFASISDEAAADAALVLDFVQPHFSVGRGPRPERAIAIEIRPLVEWRRPDTAGSRTLVRKGRTEQKHLWGTRWTGPETTTIEIPTSRTALELAADGRSARVFITATSRYHLSDFFRDIFWELAEAGGAGIFVHAAAVCDGTGVIAFTGDKGAGKTTTALDFAHAGADFYSGDVLFMDSAGSAVFSFPDYPGVCWGTIRAYPRLLEAVVGMGHTPSEVDSDKILLPHDIYQSALGVRKAAPPLPLHAVVLADVSAAGPGRLEPVESRPDLLAPMQRKTSDPEEGWEPFLREVRKSAIRTAGASAEKSSQAAQPAVPWSARRGLTRVPQSEIAAFLAETRRRQTGGLS